MENGYPRPQLVRGNWTNLNGAWDFLFDDEGKGQQEKWYERFPEKAREIRVPFSYETGLSGIGDETFHSTVWYQRQVTIGRTEKRLILHFEGVDYMAAVWVNGYFAGGHEGAYARFSVDITDYVREGSNTITVRAEDSMSCAQPRGKQRWERENFGCWYVQTTGIWKTVWMEEVPRVYVEKLKLTPDLDNAKVLLEVKLSRKSNAAPNEKQSGEPNGERDERRSEEPNGDRDERRSGEPDGERDEKTELQGQLTCRISLDGKEIALCSTRAAGEYVAMDIEVANENVPWQVAAWSPENPALYDLELKYTDEGETDAIESYFGMRKISIEGDRILLNNQPLYQRLILDQGYWEESHLTPPSEEALIQDIDLVMAAGYNGVRKHEKVEDERFLYWCDRKGLLVWCEMPSTYTFQDDAIERFTRQWMEIVRQNYSHPCIITWTAFNESWGIERVYSDPCQQKFTEGIYHLTKAFDGMRPVIVNDGWEHTVSDILTLHDYEEAGDVFEARYRDKAEITECRIPFNGKRYAMAKGYSYRGRPIIISEYGGIAYRGESGWGYGNRVTDEKSFLERFRRITGAIRSLSYAAGFCYTQVTDVQQEVNGLYTIQREPKADIEAVREINLS